MSRLDELIEELCPDGVEYISINELIKRKNIQTVTPTFKIKRNDYKEEGSVPIISQEQEFISGYCDEIDENIIDRNYVCFGDHSEHIKYVDFSFVQGADGLKIMFTNENILIARYFYHAAMSYYKRHDNYERHFKYLKDTIIPVPPLPVQEEIVRILDNFTDLVAELQAELQARTKQYEYYKDFLLTFEKNVPRKKLGDICKITSGGDVPKGHWDKEKNKNYSIPIFSNGIEYDGLYGYTDIARIEKPSVTIAGRGAGCGNTILRKEPYFPIIRLLSLVPDENVIVDYLYYCVKTIQFQIPKSGIPQLTVPMVSEYIIPVPSLEKQQEIIKILQKFEFLCNDISNGIPAEIEARQKQYEYYRDKLLTFKEVGVKL